MTTSIKNYIITYIDKDGNEQVMDSKCYLNKTLEDKPLYVSLENAKKALTSIKNMCKKDSNIKRAKHWYDEALKLKGTNSFDYRCQNNIDYYLNLIHINENNTFQIREVIIEINTNLTF